MVMKSQLLRTSKKNSCALAGAAWFVAPVLALFLAACNSSPPPVTSRPEPPQEIKAPDVPDGLLVPPGNSVSLHVYAIGVQIYDWTVNATNSAQAAWVLKAPEAALFNADGKLVGYHYGGPTWENKSGRSYVQ